MNSITTAPSNKRKRKRKRTKRNKSRKSSIDNNNKQTQNKNKSSLEKNKPSKILSIDSKQNESESKISENMLSEIDEIITTKTGQLPAPKITAHGHNYIVMEEPPEIYENVTKPFIMKYKDHKSSLWIHQCSNHTKEDEKHLKFYGDEQFIAYIRSNWIKEKKHCDPLKYPDPNEWGKHKETDAEHLRIMAIVNTAKYRDKLITLRDIRGDVHYKLLSHIKMTLCQEIERIYGVNRDKLKIYLHYRPTALLLHFHFVHINNYKQHIQQHRDHFIDDILKNIQDESDYYKYKTLPHQIYFDREKSIIFAEHTKYLMNMKGIHPWYDKKKLSEIIKRPINRSVPSIDKKLSKISKRPINRSMTSIDDAKIDNIECKTKHKYVVPKSNPMDTVNNASKTNADKIKNRFPTNNHGDNYQHNNYQYNNKYNNKYNNYEYNHKYKYNNNQYNDDSKWDRN